MTQTNDFRIAAALGGRFRRSSTASVAGASAPKSRVSGASATPPAPHPLNRRRHLDPRTKILLTLVTSLFVMSAWGDRFLIPGLILAVALAVWDRAWRRAVSIPATIAAFWLFGYLVALAGVNAISAIVVLTSAYIMRATVVFGVALHLFLTTSPAELSGGLRAMKIPRVLTVTVVLMVRLFPVVFAEAGAVRDALRLRGMTSAGAVLRHPLQSTERFLIPMIAASLRSSEDLATAAILRGFGTRGKPTNAYPPRFGLTDLAWTLITVALFAAPIVWKAL